MGLLKKQDMTPVETASSPDKNVSKEEKDGTMKQTKNIILGK